MSRLAMFLSEQIEGKTSSNRYRQASGTVVVSVEGKSNLEYAGCDITFPFASMTSDKIKDWLFPSAAR